MRTGGVLVPAVLAVAALPTAAGSAAVLCGGLRERRARAGRHREGARRDPPGTLAPYGPYGNVVTDRLFDHDPAPRKLVAVTRYQYVRPLWAEASE